MAAKLDMGHNYVSLDEHAVRMLANDDPDLFLQRYRTPLIIDEVQNAPALLGRIKAVVDESGEMGRFWLTGSQSFPLMRSVSESLAGRVGIVNMLGFSLAEYREIEPSEQAFRPDRLEESPRDTLPLLELFEWIVRGSMPRLAHADAPPWESYYGSYVQTYIERDVRSFANVTNLDAFRRFVTIAAARVGQLLNYSDIARDTGVSVSTIREWVNVLIATGQVVLLRPHFANIGKRQIKTPKLYFSDTGLVCYLTGWRGAQTASTGAMAGALFENYVVIEVYKSYLHRGREAPIWYYRNKEKREVDVIIAEDGLLYPIEVKLAAAVSKRDLVGIRSVEKAGAPLGKGALVCMIDRRLPLSRTVDAIPASHIC